LSDDVSKDESPVEDVFSPRDPVAAAFKRLAPLLLLRAMQVDAWDDWAEVNAAADDENESLSSSLLALAHASSDAPDDARRLAAELHGRVVPGFDKTCQKRNPESGAAAARVAAMESALDAFRLRDARALALASLSGLASRGVDALGPETTTTAHSVTHVRETDVRDRHRVAFVRLATFACARDENTSQPFRTNSPAAAEEENVEVAKTRAGGAETLARFIAAELAAPRAAPAGGLGAGLGDGGRASATLDGIIAAIVGDPRAPPWASLEGSKSVSSEKLEETWAKDASAATRRVASRADETSARRVALAESLTGSVRVIMNVRDRAVAEAFARATYPRLAAHAETEGSKGGERRSGVAAACFSLCAVAFAAAATDATARTLRASLDDDARKTRGGEQNAVSSRENDTEGEFRRRFHKLAVMKYAKDLARAASAALRDGAAKPEARVAAAGLATAMLAADDDALEAIARCGALDDLRLALEVAARAEDVPPLAKNARGLLKAMGA
jgi:hypothetical protein